MKASADLMRQGAHLLRFPRLEITTAVRIPQLQPCSEMFRGETKGEVFCGHLAHIARRTACHPGPELTDLREMSRPVLYARIEHGTYQLVLPNVRVEVSEQYRDSLLSADPIIKAGIALIHVARGRIAV